MAPPNDRPELSKTDVHRAIQDELGKNEERAHWHISKEISLGVILAFLVHTVAIVSFGVMLRADVNHALEQIHDLVAVRYTIEDARRDFALRDLRDADMQRQIQNIVDEKRK